MEEYSNTNIDNKKSLLYYVNIADFIHEGTKQIKKYDDVVIQVFKKMLQY